MHRAGTLAKNGNALWCCQCDCGNQKTIDVQTLKAGFAKSCGCLRRQRSKQRIQSNPKTSAHMGDTSGFFDASGVPLVAYQIRRRNRSGVLGVSFDKGSGKWVARMMKAGKLVLNKSFQNFEDAVDARRAAERKYLPERFR
nr:AP2 domain-containing protein [Lacticaseibacillus absianus]